MDMPIDRDTETETDIATLMCGLDAIEDRTWTIGELARDCSVTLRALRFYEAKGLLDPRRAGAVRLYGAEDRRRLRIIVRAKRVGFSLVQIRDLLTLTRPGSGLDRRMREVRSRLAAQSEPLEAMRREADAALAALTAEIAAFDRLDA